MNRDYIDWLETLPCNRKPQKANQWMSEWAPLPEHVDLPRYEEIQHEWNQRDCRDGVMSRLWRWGKTGRMREGDDDCSVDNGFATALAVQACNLKRGADVVIAACPSEPVRGLGSLSVAVLSHQLFHQALS